MYYPLCFKNNTSLFLNPSFPHLAKIDSLVCRLLSTADAVNLLLTLFILAQTFYICISTYKFCLLKLFVYCESMLQNLTFAYNINRLFILLRIILCSGLSNLSLFASLWHLSFYEQKNTLKVHFNL